MVFTAALALPQSDPTGDVDGDGLITAHDLVAFSQAWAKAAAGQSDWNPRADVTGPVGLDHADASAIAEAVLQGAASLPEDWKGRLWTHGSLLRGANIYQRRVYHELDDGSMGPGPLGPPFTQEDFNRLAQLGANYVNVSHPGLFTEKPPYVLDQGVVDNLDHLLDLIRAADMFAVITFRTGPGRSEFTFLLEDLGDWFDESYLNDEVWKSQAAQDAWVEMWRQAALHYRDNPIVVGYDLMCEPNANDVWLDEWDPDEFYANYGGSLYDWNQLFPRIAAAIREVDPYTPILVGGMSYSEVEWMPYLQPAGQPRMVYTFHQYQPDTYTHQDPPLKYWYPGQADIDWDGEPEAFGHRYLENLMTTVHQFAASHNVPVACNEYGLKRWEPGAARFMGDQMELFEQEGINYALWAWHPSFPPRRTDDEFNFMHGPDRHNHSDVPTSDLIEVIKSYWARNFLRPSLLGITLQP